MSRARTSTPRRRAGGAADRTRVGAHPGDLQPRPGRRAGRSRPRARPRRGAVRLLRRRRGARPGETHGALPVSAVCDRRLPPRTRTVRRGAAAQGAPASSCARSSPCPAMSLFAVTTFVVFHFALNRDSVEATLACRHPVGDAAVRRDARHQPPVRRRRRTGRLRRFLLAPVRAQRDALAKALTLLASCWCSSWSRCRPSPCCCSGRRWAGAAGPAGVLALGDLGDRGDRHARRRAGRAARALATCSGRCSRCRCSSRSLIGAARAISPLLRAARIRRRYRALAADARLSMIWCSG